MAIEDVIFILCGKKPIGKLLLFSINGLIDVGQHLFLQSRQNLMIDEQMIDDQSLQSRTNLKLPRHLITMFTL